MSSTYYSLRYHWVCSTKERRPWIGDGWRRRFHEYLGGTIRGLEGVPLSIGGVQDHVHALLGLKPTHCLSDFVREMKKATSIWAGCNHEPHFEWQEGYAVFTVSASQIQAVKDYISGQEEHRRKGDFVQELKQLLQRHDVHYDPAYLL